VTGNVADLVHVLVAAGLTYVIGFERDVRGAGAGDRTFGLIGVGAGIVGVLASHGAPEALTGALTGVGFIGAALVFRQERPDAVRGLTTAAGILAAVAVGAAAGEGRLLVAVTGAALTLLILEMRYIPALKFLEGRKWANRFAHDELPHPITDQGPPDGAPGQDPSP